MVKKYLLDTNILIDLYHNNRRVVEMMENLDMKECEICSAVTAEFFQGFYRKKNTKKEKKWYSELVRSAQMTILSFDESAAEKYAEIQVAKLKKGKPRPFFDLVIAATTIVNGMILVTSNLKDFEMIEGLKVYKAK
ncbi:MAG: type II toxin-antitoxin system VapC family toxin [Microgenomates group bacterium]